MFVITDISNKCMYIKNQHKNTTLWLASWAYEIPLSCLWFWLLTHIVKSGEGKFEMLHHMCFRCRMTCDWAVDEPIKMVWERNKSVDFVGQLCNMISNQLSVAGYSQSNQVASCVSLISPVHSPLVFTRSSNHDYFTWIMTQHQHEWISTQDQHKCMPMRKKVLHLYMLCVQVNLCFLMATKYNNSIMLSPVR